MTFSAVEVLHRINETVAVEMLVQRINRCTGSSHVFLDSEANHRDPKNLGVVITENGREKFGKVGIEDPAGHFSGRIIRVRGLVILKECRPSIEVDDPSQIEVVK